MKDTKTFLKTMGVIPVIVIEDSNNAAKLSDVLCENGLPCAEITFRTEAAKKAIEIMTIRHPEMVVGAGTVLSLEQVDKAISAGAKFIVSPCYDDEVVSYCVKKQIPIFPGCVTPTEIMYALKRNLDVVKFFPAGDFGGIKTIKALSAPFGNIKFIPTGGVNASNLQSYLENDKVFACGGTWIATKQLISAGDYETIKKNILEVVCLVKKNRG